MCYGFITLKTRAARACVWPFTNRFETAFPFVIPDEHKYKAYSATPAPVYNAV